MAELPTGTVTLLFTDLEGSTRLAEQHPAAYADTLARYHALLRRAVESHAGHIFETAGDTVFAVFGRPADAVVAALAGQLALQAEPPGEFGALAVRVGLYTGELERREGRYLGLALHRCGRLAAAAHGGQVLLSGTTRDLALDGLPPGAGLRDLGEHRFRDLRDPVHVFQLVHPDLPADFPPLRMGDDASPAPVGEADERPDEAIGPGTRLGPYQILDQVGQGGIATVYRAYQPVLSRYVAIKVLAPSGGSRAADGADDEAFRRFFRHEASLLAQLRHPNVVQVIDYGEARGVPYLVTEFIEGAALTERLGRPWPVEQVVHILAPVAAALDYLRGRGILHGDVKPANILLGRDGTPVLTDLALATIEGAPPPLAAPGVIYGTPAYIAPERAAGGAVTPAVDVYALTVTAYEMLTGRVPFAGETPRAVLQAHVQTPPPLPSAVNPGLPPYVEAALLKGLAKRPEDRFATASALVRALAGAPDVTATAAAAGPPAAPAPASLTAGARLGAYEIVEEVASGGMGTVYKAFQPRLARHVAIKVIHPHFATDTEFRRRFEREAVAIAQLRHPHILTVFDYGEDAGLAYLVTEFVDGGTLADRLGAPLSVGDTVRLLAPVAAALDHAHARGVLHRDVKPANVLLTRDGTPVLADFGLAQIVGVSSRLTETGAFFGTADYMAPEQAQGRGVGPAADRYALAVVAFELLTGRVPFAGETPLVVLRAHADLPPPAARALNPALPAGVDAALRRGLAKSAEARFASAAGLIQALAAAVPESRSAAPWLRRLLDRRGPP